MTRIWGDIWKEGYCQSVNRHLSLQGETAPPPIPHRLQAPYRRWNLQGGLRGSNSGNFISNLGSDPPGQKGTKGSEPTALTCCDPGSSSDFRGCGDPPPTSQLGLPDEGRGRGRHRGAHVPSSSGTPPTALLYLRPDSSVKRGHSRCSSVRAALPPPDTSSG